MPNTSTAQTKANKPHGEGFTRTTENLQNWLREVLHNQHPHLGLIPGFDSPLTPYEIAVTYYDKHTSKEDVASELKVTVIGLIQESFSTPWKPEAFHELCLLTERLKLTEAADNLLRGIKNLATMPDTAQTQQHQMLALRTLQGIGWKGTDSFWLTLPTKIQERWPELIISGIAATNLSAAFKEIPRLIKTEQAMTSLLSLFPALIEEHSLDYKSLARLCRSSLPLSSLAGSAEDKLRAWFDGRDIEL